MIRGRNKMSEETKFPSTVYDDDWLIAKDVYDWINQCIKDFPEYFWGKEYLLLDCGSIKTHTGQHIKDIYDWFNKYFSQFKVIKPVCPKCYKSLEENL